MSGSRFATRWELPEPGLRWQRTPAFEADPDVSALYDDLLAGRVVDAPSPNLQGLSAGERLVAYGRARGGVVRRAAEDGFRLGGNWWGELPGYYCLSLYENEPDWRDPRQELASVAVGSAADVAAAEDYVPKLVPGAPLQARDLDPWPQLRAEALKRLEYIYRGDGGEVSLLWREPYGCYFVPVDPFGGLRQALEELVEPHFTVITTMEGDHAINYKVIPWKRGFSATRFAPTWKP
jgi:hypothetical protein